MTVSGVQSAFQNPDYFSGTGSAQMALTSNGAISSASLFDESFLERKNSYQQKRESYDIAVAGRDSAIKTKISNIVSYLENGKEDKALKAYNQLIAEMSKQQRYSQLKIDDDDTQLRSVARTLIEATAGQDLETLIRENTRDAADVECQKIRSWGNCDTTSQEELLLAMCDIEEEEGNSNIVLDLINLIASPFVVIGNSLFNGGKKM